MYLGRFAWAHTLMPLLLKSDDPRIISILSAGQHTPHASWRDDFETRRCGMAQRTFAAGWYTDCACSALARAHERLTAIHIYPGMVSTNWWMEMPPGLKCLVKAMLRATGKPLRDAGEWLAYSLLAPDCAAGCFLRNEFSGPEKATKLCDDATCDGVWAKSVQIFEKHLKPVGRWASTSESAGE